MAYDIQITETSGQLVAATQRHTRRSTIGEDIGSGFAALVAAMGSAGIPAAGAPFVIYHSVIDEDTDGNIEICIPVAASIESSDDVYSCEVAAGTVATTVHRGPYPQLAAAYHAITQWIGTNGHLMAGPPREIYLNDPQTVAPEDLLTRIEWPITPNDGN